MGGRPATGSARPGDLSDAMLHGGRRRGGCCCCCCCLREVASSVTFITVTFVTISIAAYCSDWLIRVFFYRPPPLLSPSMSRRRTTESCCARVCCAAVVLLGHTSDTEIGSISWVTTPRNHHQYQARVDCTVHLCRALVLTGLTNGGRVPPSWFQSSVSRPDSATVSELSLTINERCYRFDSQNPPTLSPNWTVGEQE